MELKGLLEEVLREKEGLPGLKVNEVKTASCTKPGDNFMSVVSAVEVVGTLPDGTPYSVNLFVKWPPGSAERSLTYQVDEAFSNETNMYLRVLPLYNITVSCPRCFYAGPDVIVLQDLKKEGYVMGERSIGLDLHSSRNVLKALARFHAASYHAYLTSGKEFQTVTSLLKPIGFVVSSNKDMVETSLRRAITMVTGVQDLEDVLPTLRSFQGRVSETMRDLRKAKNITVLCHGDFWINNLLFRQTSEDPVMIVDLQACGVLSPAVDVWTFLYSSITSSFMNDENFQHLLQHYSKSFTDELISLKTSPESIPLLTDLLQELKSRELYGFLVGTMYLPALDLSTDLPDLDSVTKEQSLEDDFAEQFFGPELKSRIQNLVRLCKKRNVFK